MIGLTDAEVAERVARGQTNVLKVRTSRTLSEIVRANVFTVFNAMLFTLFVVIALTGRWQNALFGLVILANAGIGIVQELRAKHTLDRLALLSAPRARVIRGGQAREIDAGHVVLDDLIEIRAGDQVVADGFVQQASGLELDESLLSGESHPVAKTVGQELRSGSIVVAGSGICQATAVGDHAYAASLAAQARRFALTRSELVSSTNRLLRWIAGIMLLLAPVLLWSQFRSADNHGWQDAVTGTTAALVGMVPEGLVLLTSVAFMVGVVSLARQQTLVQELPAVEVLARVDVMCLDKTGTLTYGDIQFDRVQLLENGVASDVADALGLLAASPEPNATTVALAQVYRDTSWSAHRWQPFSAARKWSSVGTVDAGTWILGAPEILLAEPANAAEREARAAADRIAAQELRVLLLLTSPHEPPDGDDVVLPAAPVPVALVVFSERVREDAAETLRFFAEQGVAIKVISGDNPRTVGAIAARAGVPGASADLAVDARQLPEDPGDLALALDQAAVIGRATPYQKQAFVAALQSRGHVVAMTGDGVNDVLALKDADVGIAMVNGSPATRAVAQLVLMDGRFSHLPHAVAEGRRVIANIERASNLFLIKNVYSLVLAVVTAATLVAYPLAPIQLTLISTLSIGVPGFVLALAPNTRRYEPGFLRRSLRFAVPTGVLIGLMAYAAYRLARLVEAGSTVAAARSAATITVMILGLWVLVILARPLSGWKRALVAAMTAVATFVVIVPNVGTRIFLLEPSWLGFLVATLAALVGGLLIEVTRRVSLPKGRTAVDVPRVRHLG